MGYTFGQDIFVVIQYKKCFGWLFEMSETLTITFLKLYKITHTGRVQGVEVYIQCNFFFSIYHPYRRLLFSHKDNVFKRKSSSTDMTVKKGVI